MWMFSSTNEDRNFTGGTMYDIAPSDPAWVHDFRRKRGSSYEVVLGLDKIVHGTSYLDRYSYVGFTDNLDLNGVWPKPTPDSNLVVQLNFTVAADDRRDSPDPNVGVAKTRFLVGIVARSRDGTRSHYLEVNLRRSANFDLCVAGQNLGGGGVLEPCDEANLYARRARWVTGASSGEVVTFDADAQADTQNSSMVWPKASHGKQRARLPVGHLFRIAPWVTKPSADSRIAGVYVGTEVWGAGRTLMKFDGYEFFRE